MIQRILIEVLIIVTCWNVFLIVEVMEQTNKTHDVVMQVGDLVINGSMATVELHKRILRLETK